MKEERDNLAMIGVGTLIVFIATILVAGLVASVIIQAAEKMGQQTQHTAHDATKESATQVIVLGAWVEDNYDDYLFMVEYQSQGKNVQASDVDWILSCEHNGNFYYRSGSLDSWISGTGSIWEVGDDPTNSVTELESGKRYFFGIDAGTNDLPGGAHCGPNWIHQRGITATLMVNMPNGGISTQILKVSDLEVGASVT